MSLAFLILTIDTPNNHSINYLIKHNYNIYIHPKNEIDKKYRKYIIPKIAETKWCDVVEAEINLLEEALKNPKNKYFIMVSGDAYLLYNSDQINKFDPIYSCFSFSKNYELHGKKYYKTATWWILNRNDAEIICNKRDKYLKEFETFKDCKEEFYFLTVLNNEIKDYIYINHKYTYTKWLFNLGMSHPITYNKLTHEDVNDIQNKNYIFLRKVLPTFNFKPMTNFKKDLYILCIGTETKEETINYFLNNDLDFIIVTFISIKEINNKLLEKCISIYGSIIYNEYYLFILDICTFHNYYLQQWKGNIIFISEAFNINSKKINNNINNSNNNSKNNSNNNNSNNENNNENNNKNIKNSKTKLVSLPIDKYKIKKFFNIFNKKLFKYFTDKNQNKSYYISNKNIKKLCLSSFKIEFDFPL